MRAIRTILVLSALATLVWSALPGCATPGRVKVEGESGSVTVDVDRENGYYRGTLPKVPPGHMPPPGKCRIWIPGVPPGKQAPPGDCRELRNRVPPGAWLIHGK